MPQSPSYDAILLVSFGGPEAPEDVIPFLENVLRGKPVPRERLLEVAEHYQHFGGVSPINQQCRDLLAALRTELDQHDITLPLYWGNRNWHPLLPETVRQMAADGVQRALAVFTSAYSSYSGCRQYRENLADAQSAVGPDAPAIDRVRMFFNHPEFIAANVERVAGSLATWPEELRDRCRVLYTAHSIPLSMAQNCAYEQQLRETCGLVSAALGIPQERWRLVYQSRSGRPQDPWLEPDVLDALRQCREEQVPAVVVVPLGFLSDHMEVLYDLDEEAQNLARELELPMLRAPTVGTHPRFVTALRMLIEERLGLRDERAAVGRFPASHDVCSESCCLYPRTRPTPSNTAP